MDAPANEPKQPDLITEYMNTLDEKEALIFKIAAEHMGTSYDVERSNGFIAWLKTRNK